MLKKLLFKAKVKQQYLAAVLGVTQQNISRWCVGRSFPPIKLIPKLAELLNCSIEELVFAIIETQKQEVSA